MSESVHIFLRTGVPLSDVAGRIAATIDGWTQRDPGGSVFVGRAVRTADSAGECGGELTSNGYAAPPDPEPDERSALDGYDMVWEIRCTVGDTGTLRQEAERLFAALTGRERWPALLVTGLATLVAAAHPERGRTTFPEATSVDGDDHDRWREWVPDAG